MYDGIIFDKDGVLLDSGINRFRWMDQVRTEAAEDIGHSFTVEDSYQLVHSNSAEDVGNFLENKGMTWEELKYLENQVQQRKKKLMKKKVITLFPKVEKVLENIEQEKAVVSNAPNDVTRFTLNHFDIKKHFSKVNATSIEKPRLYYKRKKPKPIMIREVMDDLGFKNPLMIGDTSADVRAAKNTGIDVVHVNSYGFEPGAEPDYTVSTVGKVQEIIENS